MQRCFMHSDVNLHPFVFSGSLQFPSPPLPRVAVWALPFHSSSQVETESCPSEAAGLLGHEWCIQHQSPVSTLGQPASCWQVIQTAALVFCVKLLPEAEASTVAACPLFPICIVRFEQTKFAVCTMCMFFLHLSCNDRSYNMFTLMPRSPSHFTLFFFPDNQWSSQHSITTGTRPLRANGVFPLDDKLPWQPCSTVTFQHRDPCSNGEDSNDGQ